MKIFVVIPRFIMMNQKWGLTAGVLILCLVTVSAYSLGSLFDKAKEILVDPITSMLGRIDDFVTEDVIEGTLTKYTYKLLLRHLVTIHKKGRILLFSVLIKTVIDVPLVLLEMKFVNYTAATCRACRLGARLTKDLMKLGMTDEQLIDTINFLCVSFHIESQNVCYGATLSMGGELLHVLRQTDMTPTQVCGFFLAAACKNVDNPHHEWTITFPPVPKPPVQLQTSPRENGKTLKVLHISDTHFDPEYQEGSNAACGEPLCCRSTNGPAKSPADAAGKWGDYRKCDVPKRTIDHMLEHIGSTHPDIDYIIWTGDLPPHDVWKQTREGNLNILHETSAQMAAAFPGVPIFPALGNHESAPVNSFPPPFAPAENSISWLYDELEIEWRRWIPGEESPTVKRGAFYSVLVKPGFRIISINTNYCNDKNWWLAINSTDPVDELQWLVNALQGAEDNGELVHIIGHIPPGQSDCLIVWSRNYYDIINRYESTVAAQFFGHTHYDEFELFYDPSNFTRPVSIAYIGPSVTPYYDLNPGYRIYYVDDDHLQTTRMVLDHETWVMNLDEANQGYPPNWYKMYTAKQDYQMSSLSPRDWDLFIDKIINEKSTFDLYYKHYYKNSPVRPSCDHECRKKLICDLRNGRSQDREARCQYSNSILDSMKN